MEGLTYARLVTLLHADQYAQSSGTSQTRRLPVAGHHMPIRPAWGLEGIFSAAGLSPKAVLVQQIPPGLGDAGRPGRVLRLQEAASFTLSGLSGLSGLTTCQRPSSVAKLDT